VLVIILGSVALAQKEKAWTDWSAKDTTKMLNDSPWGQTQLETTEATGSVSAISSTSGGRNVGVKDPSKENAGAITSYIKYYIRLLSAKPIRQAVVRRLQLEQPAAFEQQAEQLKAFTEATTGDYIVVAVAAEAKDKSMGAMAMKAFQLANMESLAGTTYLELKNGQRVPLMDFKQAVADGLGVKYVFPRTVQGQPLVKGEDEQLHFVSQVSKSVKLEARFKLSEMTYSGKLEY
jgi:hypothetical protein